MFTMFINQTGPSPMTYEYHLVKKQTCYTGSLSYKNNINTGNNTEHK